MALDLTIAALAIAATVIGFHGGVTFSVAGLRISAHGPGRVLAATLVLAVIRLFVAARAPLFGVPAQRWRALWQRVYRTTAWPALTDGSPTRPRHVLWAACGLTVACGLILHEQLAHMHSVPDLGDPLFSMWRIGWVFHQMHGDPRPLFDANIFYPHPLTFTYSDSMLLPAVAAAPLLALGLAPVVVYNLLFMAAFVLSGLAMYLLAARLTRSPAAAFVPALIFAVYPYRFEHYSHLELQMAMWMPLALLALDRFVETTQVRDALATAAAVVAQLYSSMYYAVFFLLYLVPVAAVLLVVRKTRVWRLMPGALVAGALAAACAFPLAHAYDAAQAAKGNRGPAEVEIYSATPADYFHAHERSALYGDILLSHHPERALFPGVMTLGLAAAGLAPPLGPLSLVYGAGLAFAWDASLGMHGSIYPRLYDWLPPVRGMRVAARFSILVGLTLALFAGFGTRRLLACCRSSRQRHLLLFGLSALIVVDVWPQLGLRPVWPAPPATYAFLPSSPNVVLAEFPILVDSAAPTEGVPFMYFSIWHWKNMVNGYSGFFPKDYDAFVDEIENVPSPAAIAALKRAGVTHVTFTCALYRRQADCDEILGAVESSPHFHRVVRLQWQGAPAVLYELR
ncbi:MAG TPA: hypothetical protein VG538_04620 [Vicinamibacterales bacterium]|nr:hypothetical protein [Vicinamibacterales bacterium]